MYGMGQIAARPVAQTDWASIERIARQAAANSSVAAMGVWSATLRSLADTIAVRSLASQWLAMPPSRHREGLLAIADFAANGGRSARHAVPPAQSTAAATPGSARSPASADEILAVVRAEMDKPSPHPDVVKIMDLARYASAGGVDLYRFVYSILPRVKGDAQAALAVLAVLAERTPRAGSARATPPGGSPPGEPSDVVPAVNGIGSYYSY